eukprot:266467-Rhodomonas_salina.1
MRVTHWSLHVSVAQTSLLSMLYRRNSTFPSVREAAHRENKRLTTSRRTLAESDSESNGK